MIAIQYIIQQYINDISLYNILLFYIVSPETSMVVKISNKYIYVIYKIIEIITMDITKLNGYILEITKGQQV